MSPPVVLHVAAVEYSVRTLLLPQLDWLAAHGFDVRVACTPEEDRFHPSLEPYRPVPVSIPRSLDHRVVKAAATVMRAVRQVKPDILHLHSPAAALIVRSIPRAVLGDTSVVYTVHGFAFQPEDRSTRSRLLHRLERSQAKRTDALLFQSREDLDLATRDGFSTRLVHLGNGIGDEWFGGGPREPADPLRLLFVGRLVREKGLLDLLAAVAAVPAVTLTIVGKEIPSERDAVGADARALIHDLRLGDRVRFTGFLTGDHLRRVYAEHDVFVLPSYREGLPRSIIEALATGLPVVATTVRGCRELVDDQVSGILIPPGAPQELGAALRALAGMSRSELTAMSKAALASAEAHRESAVFERLELTYRSIASGQAT